MDTFATVLSVFSTVCAIVFGYIAFVRNRDKDKESNVKHDATVLTEIGYIKANTDEIKAEQKEQRKKICLWQNTRRRLRYIWAEK